MIKITLVAPYKELIDLAVSTFQEHSEYEFSENPDCLKNEYELECVVAIGSEATKINMDADVIIARGSTANMIKDCQNRIPVVEIPLAGNDLIRSLYESKRLFGNRRVAVIGSKNMIFGAEDLSDIVELEIKAYTMRSYEDKPLIDVALSEGCEVIVSGVTMCEYARKLGLYTIMPRTGRESLWQVITEAKRVAHISRREQEKAQLFQTILDYAYEGLVAVDKSNVVSVFNVAAQKNLRIHEATGKRIEEVLPGSRLSELLIEEREHLDEIIRHNDVQLTVNKVPIILKGENVGNVLAFQNVTRIQEMEGKIREKIYTRGHVAKHNFEDILGESEKILETIQMAKRFSQVDSNILIIGETGTGKELFAQSIHRYSFRKEGPFVAVNCAALPENLLESELFGYMEGAFTGAAKGGKPGLFELAHRGTIFLDEITEISPKLQGRLLRVIQEKEIMRLGHDRVIPVDVRVISATNRDLYSQVKKGDFREDLYYRLDVLKINLPSLKERSRDIPLIIEHFIRHYAFSFGRGTIIVTEAAKKRLQGYEWHGNIRELRNICERLVVLNNSRVIGEEDVDMVLMQKTSAQANSNIHLAAGFSSSAELSSLGGIKRINRERIEAALEKARHNRNKAAEILGVSRTTLWRLIKEFKIK